MSTKWGIVLDTVCGVLIGHSVWYIYKKTVLNYLKRRTAPTLEGLEYITTTTAPPVNTRPSLLDHSNNMSDSERQIYLDHSNNMSDSERQIYLETCGFASPEFEVEVRQLLRTNYLPKYEQCHQNVIDQLTSLDIKERLLKSLREGWAGFQIIDSRFLSNPAAPQSKINELRHLIENKIIDAGLNGILYYSLVGDQLDFRIENHLLPNYQSTNLYMNRPICDEGQTVEQSLEILGQSVQTLTQKVDIHLDYMPGGPGYIQSMESFTQKACLLEAE